MDISKYDSSIRESDELYLISWLFHGLTEDWRITMAFVNRFIEGEDEEET